MTNSKTNRSWLWFLMGGGLVMTLLSAGWFAHAAIDPARTWGTIPYRGQLEINGQAAEGTVDLTFALWNAETGGTKPMILGCTGASSCSFDAMPCAGGGSFVAEIV